ncbi:MAG: DUF190 domain-containing protein [Solirubrobacteraceae bacterium]
MKLTTFFGERDRSHGRFLADELIDLYERRDVAVSVLLRGAEGFGLRHHLRTDRLLTLSEDLPLLSVAVDRRERIEGLLPPLLELKRKGLITLERARLLTGSDEPGAAGEDVKLTIYVGRRELHRRRPMFIAVCRLLQQHDVAGATVLLGVDGTIDGGRARARFFARNADVPVMVTAVMSTGQLAGALPNLRRLLPRPMLTVEQTRICKRDGELLDRPQPATTGEKHGHARWQKLTVYTSQHLSAEGPPAHSEMVRRLRDAGGSGATNLRGIWGFHGDHAAHGDKLLQLRRHAPVVTIIIDAPERIASAFAIVDELTPEHGLVTSDAVPALLAISETERRGGLQLFDDA